MDPLSLFLFLICSEGLSSLIRLSLHTNLLKGAKASRRGSAVSHLLFADDSIIFGEATEGARGLKSVLAEYEEGSSQIIKYEKSIVFYSSNTSN